jgi:hypothetical protein
VAQLSVDIPASLRAELESETGRSGRSPSSIVISALAQFLDRPIHTVFQVSTSGVLVAGVYDREVSVERSSDMETLAWARLPTWTAKWSSSTAGSFRFRRRGA